MHTARSLFDVLMKRFITEIDGSSQENVLDQIMLGCSHETINYSERPTLHDDRQIRSSKLCSSLHGGFALRSLGDHVVRP